MRICRQHTLAKLGVLVVLALAIAHHASATVAALSRAQLTTIGATPETLFDGWIVPIWPKLQNLSPKESGAVIQDIADGLKDFCSAKNGRFSRTSPGLFHCAAADGSLIADFKITYYPRDGKESVELTFDSPAKQVARKEMNDKQAARRAENGPQGRVVLRDGSTLEVLRFGTLEQRDLILVETDQGRVPLEQVRRIVYVDPTRPSTGEVELLDGAKRKGGQWFLEDRLAVANDIVRGQIFYTMDYRVVVRMDKELVTKRINDVASIEISAAPPTLPGGPLTTQFSLEPYRAHFEHELRLQVLQQFQEMEKAPWGAAVRDGKVSGKLADHLQAQLKGILDTVECKQGGARTGIASPESALRCEQAAKEHKLPRKIPIGPDEKPLTATLLVATLKRAPDGWEDPRIVRGSTPAESASGPSMSTEWRCYSEGCGFQSLPSGQPRDNRP